MWCLWPENVTGCGLESNDVNLDLDVELDLDLDPDLGQDLY